MVIRRLFFKLEVNDCSVLYADEVIVLIWVLFFGHHDLHLFMERFRKGTRTVIYWNLLEPSWPQPTRCHLTTLCYIYPSPN